MARRDAPLRRTPRRIVNIGRLGGGRGELDLDALALKRVRVIGSTFRIRDQEEIAKVVADLRASSAARWRQASCGPLIDSSFLIEDVEAAHARMARDEHLGKIVLEVVSWRARRPLQPATRGVSARDVRYTHQHLVSTPEDLGPRGRWDGHDHAARGRDRDERRDRGFGEGARPGERARV